MESLLTFPWSSCLCFHFYKKHLVVAGAEAKEVKESIWQALNDVLAIKAEKFTRIGPKDLAAGLGECHHGELLNVRFSHG